MCSNLRRMPIKGLTSDQKFFFQTARKDHFRQCIPDSEDSWPICIQRRRQVESINSALVLAELSLIQSILLPCRCSEIRTRKGDTEKGEALLTKILLHTHGIGLVDLALLDACCAGGADACAAGAGHWHSCRFRSGQNGLIVAALEMMLLAIQLNGDSIYSWSDVAHRF